VVAGAVRHLPSHGLKKIVRPWRQVDVDCPPWLFLWEPGGLPKFFERRLF